MRVLPSIFVVKGLRVRPRKGVCHTFCMSKAALGAGKVMMMCCHHLDWAVMRCRQVDVPPIGPSPPDEVLLYWSVDQYNNVQKL